MTNKFINPFQVNENPHCVWDENISERNSEFLNRIDPEYFIYMAETNFAILEDETSSKKKRQHAATALRTGYSQGLETLFALLFSTIQAPQSIFAWLLKYQTGDLKKIIEKITDKKELSSILNKKVVTWKLLSELIFSYVQSDDKEKFIPYITAFENLWRNFALDFINPNFSDEYNSIKHGLRVRMGGFHFAIGKQSPLTKDNSIIYSTCEFGSSFLTPQKLDKYNFAVNQHSRNWYPENYFHALNLISTSIHNIVAFLKHFNGLGASELNYSVPHEIRYFQKPWGLIAQTIDLKFSPNPDSKKIQLLTKDEIETIYEKKS